jgi:phosphoglycolate phosphatase-like HAD superfamily hydrolase
MGWRQVPAGGTGHASPPCSRDPPSEVLIYRLILWNIDLTLLDVGRVTREAYADAFRKATGRPLVRLPQMAGSTESEIFFEALALNETPAGASAPAGEEILARFTGELAPAFRARRALLREQGRLLPGAAAAVTEVGRLPGVVQTLLTGAIKPNAIEKLRAFGLERLFDTEVGGYGSEVYPKGALLLNARRRAAEKYGADFTQDSTVFIADSVRDVAAASMGGARCVAVASGRSSAGELRDAGADVVLADLADTAHVVRAVDWLTTPATTG